MKPWVQQLVAEMFSRGPAARLEDVARLVRKTPEECERALASKAAQQEIALYNGAMRKHLVAQRVAPMAELAQWGHEAARGLVAAMWLAAERENIRELIHASTKVLDYIGYSPVKRTEKAVTHTIDIIHDPAILAKIIEDGVLPTDLMLEGPKR